MCPRSLKRFEKQLECLAKDPAMVLADVNLIIKAGNLSQESLDKIKSFRLELMRVIIGTTNDDKFHVSRESGWNLIEGLGLKGGGLPSPDRDFSFANESSNSNDSFTFANSSDLSDSEPINEAVEKPYLCDHFPNIIYPAVGSRDPSFSKINPPAAQCSKTCNKPCNELFLSWTEEEVQSIRDTFVASNKTMLKNKLLAQLHFQKAAGLPVNGFFFHQHLLCPRFFSFVTDISMYLILLVIKGFFCGYHRYVHGNSYKKKNHSAKVNFTSWVKVFSENYGQVGPTDIVTILPSYINKSELFKIYSNEAPKPLVKMSTFYKLMKTVFGPRRENRQLPWIRISKESTHSKCDVCCGLDQFRRGIKNKITGIYGGGSREYISIHFSN